MAVLVSWLPCLVHEDEHLLVVNKPAGLNTHAPSPYAGEGMHEWLKNRDAKWSRLAIVHRLDKGTSGVMVFAKTKLANQSLTQQFATRRVRKTYLLLSAQRPEKDSFTVRSLIARSGEKYFAGHQTGEPAETTFEYLAETNGRHLIAAVPLTGRTHQIRVHAAWRGFPIVGDETYGGIPFPRVCLHARELSLEHPVSRERLHFQADVDFGVDTRLALRDALIDPVETNAYRLAHGELSEGTYIDRWGDHLLIGGEHPPRNLPSWNGGIYFKTLNRQVQHSTVEESSPRHLAGLVAPEAFEVQENAVRYEISFSEGYSTGLFLDQRENRRRLLTRRIASDFALEPREILNTFSYTCAFSVCGALAGGHCTSLDLSRKYLDWGERNFRLNHLDPAAHDFVFGDVFDWVPRLHKKGRSFDLILLDPPTFSRAKRGRTFQAERDYGRLVKFVLPLLRKGGVLFASTNAHKLTPESFTEQVTQTVLSAGRTISKQHYVAQPFDFPISKATPAHLKTLWLGIQ